MENNTFDPRVSMLGHALIRASDDMLSNALTVADGIEPGEGSSKMLLAVMALAAPLQFIAGAIAKTPEGKQKTDGINKETMLIAGLIAGRCVQAAGEIGRIDFSSRNILAAIDAAAKVVGKDMSQYCDPDMIKTYKKGLAEKGQEDLGYWSYLQDVGPSFEGFDGLAAYSSSRH